MVPIGELVRVIGGGTPTRDNPDFYGGDIPWVTPKDMKTWAVLEAKVNITQQGLDRSAARMAPANSVLIVVRSGVLKHTLPVGINHRAVAINQDMKALICSSSIMPSYLARFIKARSSQILKWVRATTADNFPIGNLKDLIIPLPSLAVQEEVTRVLDRADALRDQRRRAIVLLDDLTQSTFLDMFGDPAKNPLAWPFRYVGDLVDSAIYGTSAKAGTDGDLPVLRMGNLTTTGELDLRELKYLDSAVTNGRHLVRNGDMLFNRTNSPDLVGKTAVYHSSDPMAYAGYLVRVRVNSANDSEYVAAFLNTRYAKRVLRGMCKSIIGMANINARELLRIRMPAPPLSLQYEFSRRVRSVRALKEIHRAQLAELDGLFAAVQHRAFRGELWDDPAE